MRFGVGAGTAIRRMAAVEATGTLAARPQGRPRRSKLDPYEAFPRDLIEEKADITPEKTPARLLKEHGLTVGLGTLWSFLDARPHVQKRQPTPPSRTARP